MPVIAGGGETTLTVESTPGSGNYTDLTGYLRQDSLTVKFNTFDFELEDGTGHIILEDFTDWAPGVMLTEAALTHGYAGLSVQVRTNSTPGGAPQTLGRAAVFQPGLRPGNQFLLSSLNQGYSNKQ